MNRFVAMKAIEMSLDWMADAKPDWLNNEFHETLGMIRMAFLQGVITEEEASEYRRKAFDIRYKI